MFHSFLEPRKAGEDLLQGLLDARLVAADIGAHHQILQHRQAADDPAPLGHVRDAQLDDLVRLQVGDRLTVIDDLPAPDPVQGRDASQGSCLAGAVAPDQGDDLAFIHLEGDAVQSVDVAVKNVQVLDFQHHATAPLPR